MADPYDAFLSRLPDNTQEVTRYLRVLVKKIMPQAHEFIYGEAINYSLTESAFDRICQVSPQNESVMVKFFFGNSLFDPKHVLKGKGTRMRHIRIQTIREAKAIELTQLLKDSWKDAPHNIVQLHARRRKHTT